MPKSSDAIEHRRRHLSRRNAANLDVHLRVRRSKLANRRQQRMDGSFVRTNHHASAPNLLQLSQGDAGIGRETEQPARIVLQQPSSFGQRTVT